jgi:hypothetical protein
VQRMKHFRAKSAWIIAAMLPIAGWATLARGSAPEPLPAQGAAQVALAAATSAPVAAAVPVQPGSAPRPWVQPVGARDDREYSAHRASFSLRFRGHESPFQLMSVFLLPGERLQLEVVEPGRRQFLAEAPDGALRAQGPATWSWDSPQKPGRYSLRVTETGHGGETVYLNAFVMVPYDGADRLNGYRIGRYGEATNPKTQPPRGFIEVRREDVGTWVSPHFRIEQFLSKQASDFPKYVLLQEPLLLKLERILEEVNAKGIEADTFHVMSAFRTPFYNASIGNKTIYSRHHYGDAADIYIDQTGDGWMDDLNGDGVVDQRDAQFLYDLVEGLHQHDEHFHVAFNGGLGLYAPRPGVHPPFVHVDTRGERARW